MARKKVLVTGGHGFIGQHLVDRLNERGDVQLRIFDRQNHSLEERESLEDLVEGCTHVFHLAGITDSTDPQLLEVNVLGTRNLLEALAERSPGARLIFSSSFAVYRTPKRGEKIDENFPTEPRNQYGQSKLKAEEIIQSFVQTGKIKAVILRLSNVYGPSMPPFRHSVVATFLELVREEKRFAIDGDGSQTRDFVYVTDVVEAMVLAAFTTRLNSAVINICSGKETSLIELIQEIERVTGRKAKVVYNREADGSKGGFWQGDNILAKELLSWKQRASLKEGLRKI